MSLKSQYTKKAIASDATDMHEKECIERFGEGLKLAISCAKELHERQPKQGWAMVAEGFKNLLITGRKAARAKPVTRGDLLMDAARIQRSLDTSVT